LIKENGYPLVKINNEACKIVNSPFASALKLVNAQH